MLNIYPMCGIFYLPSIDTGSHQTPPSSSFALGTMDQAFCQKRIHIRKRILIRHWGHQLNISFEQYLAGILLMIRMSLENFRFSTGV